jgi:hypothetical protein
MNLLPSRESSVDNLSKRISKRKGITQYNNAYDDESRMADAN